MRFNTRARARRARTHAHGSAGIACFNTRARARRAQQTAVFVIRDDGFQHTCPREAGTRGHGNAQFPTVVSTHVPARGGHQNWQVYSQVMPSFNTRARARRARMGDRPVRPSRVFQHTCPREAGTAHRGRGAVVGVFQHTCPREAGTGELLAGQRPTRVSTHVPARGGHRGCHQSDSRRCRFNTRARARRAHGRLAAATKLKLVSTHVPARGGHRRGL